MSPSPVGSLEGLEMQRCPLAPHGLASDLMAACPGFDPSHLTMGPGPGEGLTGQTCSHIGSGRTARGFTATCLHPEAERVVAESRRIARTALSPAVPAGGC